MRDTVCSKGELTHDEFAREFAPLQAAEARSISYCDMYRYCWCNEEYDPLFERLNTMHESDEYGRRCSLIIPPDEKAKLIGTWTIFSHEFDGDVRFASDGDIEGRVVIDENYRVTLYDSDTEILHRDMDMIFVNEAYSDYMENTDWYVWLSGDNMDGDEFYMNVTPDGQLCTNFINTENDEYYISAWSYYDRVSE